jgi:hypothetical protein
MFAVFFKYICTTCVVDCINKTGSSRFDGSDRMISKNLLFLSVGNGVRSQYQLISLRFLLTFCGKKKTV